MHDPSIRRVAVSLMGFVGLASGLGCTGRGAPQGPSASWQGPSPTDDAGPIAADDPDPFPVGDGDAGNTVDGGANPEATTASDDATSQSDAATAGDSPEAAPSRGRTDAGDGGTAGDASTTPLAPPAPGAFFAPYVDTTAWPPFDLVGTAKSYGVKRFTLAFVVDKTGSACEGSWGTYYGLDGASYSNAGDVNPIFGTGEIDQIRSLGGDVVISFGGAAGTELAQACTSIDNLKSAMEVVVKAYNATVLDFDIEGAAVADPTSIDRRSGALAALQKDLSLAIWLTLPALPTGLDDNGAYVLDSAVKHGVALGGVNAMAMDYGDSAAPKPSGQMGTYAIEVGQALFLQLKAVHAKYGVAKTDAQLWAMVGLTAMIGMNDVTTEVFSPADARQLLTFSQSNALGRLAFWSANRDRQCEGGAMGYVDGNCSSVAQAPFAFSTTLNAFNR